MSFPAGTHLPTGLRREERQLRSRVERALLATGYAVLSQVRVSVHENLVVLQGQVETYYLKQLAQAVTLRLEGVESLQNHIVVR